MARRRRIRWPEPVPIFVQGLAADGTGTGELEGRAVRVLGGLPGETVLGRHLRRKRRTELFVAESVEVPAAERVTPICEAFGRCGGCTLQHLAPAAQLRHRQQQLEALFNDAGLRPATWLPPLAGPTQGYRFKARLGVRRVHRKERVLVGFREYATGWVVETDACPVLAPAVGERLRELGDLIGQLDAADRIPQLEVAVGDADAALIVRHLEPLGEADRLRLQAYAESSGLLLFLQPGGPETVHPLLPAQPRLLSYPLEAHGLRMTFRPEQFTQVNPAMNARMVDQVLQHLQLQATDRVLDLFCGIGNFSLPLARHCAQVTGVEGDGQLVEQAARNASGNGLENCRFVTADLYADYTGSPWSHADYDCVLLDPPRTGALEVMALLGMLAPRKVVYVSCNPVTLARDSVDLCARGFRLEAAGIMDMFPHTAHVESMAVFTR